jgi:hypothetical protein
MSTANQFPVYSFPQLLRRLPPHARAKFNALVALVDDSEALLARAFEREHGLGEQRDAIAYRLGHLDRASEADTIAEIKAEMDVIDAEVQKLSDERAKRNATHANAQQVISQLRDQFIPSIGLDLPGSSGTALRAVDVRAKPRDGETLAAAITRTRGEISNAKGELGRVKIAPPSRAEIERALRAEVQRLITKGTPNVNVADGKITVFWPDTPTLGGTPGVAVAAPSGSASALIAAMFPDELLALLSQGVDQIEGIGAAERASRVAEIGASIERLEHQEESLVVQAIAAGLDVHRRATASGWALLGIERATQEAMQAA